LTWICPPIGHLGIVTSEGVIHDFGGPYFVNKHRTSTVFGRPTKYYRVDLQDLRSDGKQKFTSTAAAIQAWDSSIETASAEYECLMHNLICTNCHSHDARVLNLLRFKNLTVWCTFLLILFMFIFGKSVSWKRWLQTYLVSIILLSLFVVLYSAKEVLF